VFKLSDALFIFLRKLIRKRKVLEIELMSGCQLFHEKGAQSRIYMAFILGTALLKHGPQANILRLGTPNKCRVNENYIGPHT